MQSLPSNRLSLLLKNRLQRGIIIVPMAERTRFYEHRWARAAASVVGLLALSGCLPNKSSGDNYDNKESGYTQLGQLECYEPEPAPLKAQYDFSDRAARAIVVLAVMEAGAQPKSMRVKLLGPESSVLATNQTDGPVDTDEGTLAPGAAVEITNVIPGVKVTASMPEGPRELVDVVAECT